ncbi:hypothetical protein GCM10027280_22320 [Micromonospora polyrhachis]|uniref:Putative membrane protein n=1 Tax=Micromonospora polyrhachis TaxID=1282883 RepID=A0A7W7SWC0_9ACTN|nr:hypothetical protein [Micromonospora polyrhachis]MBB4961557.1 putative membrane protein [Micromonospora polyrhachis]
MKWYYFVIAGVIALCLICSCAGGVAYFAFRDRPGGGVGLDLPGTDPTAGCAEALRGAPSDNSGDAGDPAKQRRWAAHYREAAEKANNADIRSAILEEAAAFDKYANTLEEVNAKKSAGTDDVDDVLALTRGLRERIAAHRKVMLACQAAGYN